MVGVTIPSSVGGVGVMDKRDFINHVGAKLGFGITVAKCQYTTR